MAKATIKAKSGAHITVEGTEAEVSNIIALFERSAAVHSVKEAVARNRVEKKEHKKRATAADMIIELKEDGYFSKPRKLSEISDALEEKGHLYPVTTLSGVALGLVKRRMLSRKKKEGAWVYGK